MKNYTIEINNSYKKNDGFNFRSDNNYSKSLDDLILSNLIKTNPYLSYLKKDDNTSTIRINIDRSKKDDHIIIPNRNYSSSLKGNFDIDFARAAKFLSTYTPNKKYIYTFNDDDIMFFEDEIQIGSTLIPLYMLENSYYYKDIPTQTKNIIINLFITINK